MYRRDGSAGEGGGSTVDIAGRGGDDSPAPGSTGNEPGVAEGGSGNGGEGGGSNSFDAGHDLYPYAPYANTSVAEQKLDIFGTVGTKFYLGVSRDQVELMNPIVVNGAKPDKYKPTPRQGEAITYADYLWITGEDGATANYGRVRVKVVGEETFRPWTVTAIPNLNIDSNQFVAKQLIDGYEHLRLNNAQLGTIFREWLSLTLIRSLNYPAAQASFALVSSNVWGPGVEVPMVLVERYKRRFCRRIEEWGGECNNMWEFNGDFEVADGGPAPGAEKPAAGAADIPPQPASKFDDASRCQFDTCDNGRVKELETLVYRTRGGEGFKAALASHLDWPAFHRYQCISWVLALGDDVLHSRSNVVLAEGADGKFRYLPYSTDVSLGHSSFSSVPLEVPSESGSSIARGCRADKQCWADTLATCEGVVADFVALDPQKVLSELHATLNDRGMLRAGDEAEYQLLQEWLESHLVNLPKELESYR